MWDVLWLHTVAPNQQLIYIIVISITFLLLLNVPFSHCSFRELLASFLCASLVYRKFRKITLSGYFMHVPSRFSVTDQFPDGLHTEERTDNPMIRNERQDSDSFFLSLPFPFCHWVSRHSDRHCCLAGPTPPTRIIHSTFQGFDWKCVQAFSQSQVDEN